MSSKPKKKRNKKYTPIARDNVKMRFEPYRVNAIFNPIECIIKQLETEGTINTSTSGRPMFLDDAEGIWFDTVEALNGLIEAFEIHEARAGVDLGLAPLKMLSNRFEYGMPIFADDVAQVKRTLQLMRSATMDMTAGYARDLIQDFWIKEGIEKCTQQPFT